MMRRAWAWLTRCECRAHPYLEHRRRRLHYTIAKGNR